MWLKWQACCSAAATCLLIPVQPAPHDKWQPAWRLPGHTALSAQGPPPALNGRERAGRCGWGKQSVQSVAPASSRASPCSCPAKPHDVASLPAALWLATAGEGPLQQKIKGDKTKQPTWKRFLATSSGCVPSLASMPAARPHTKACMLEGASSACAGSSRTCRKGQGQQGGRPNAEREINTSSGERRSPWPLACLHTTEMARAIKQPAQQHRYGRPLPHVPVPCYTPC